MLYELSFYAFRLFLFVFPFIKHVLVFHIIYSLLFFFLFTINPLYVSLHYIHVYSNYSSTSTQFPLKSVRLIRREVRRPPGINRTNIISSFIPVLL